MKDNTIIPIDQISEIESEGLRTVILWVTQEFLNNKRTDG